MTALPADELRLLVREVLRDLLPAISAATGPTAPPPTAPPPSVAGPARPGTPGNASATGGRAGHVSMATAPAGHVPGASAETPGRTPAAEPVVIVGDDDLNAFALRVLDLAADPARAAALRSGRLRFRLAAPASASAAAQPAQEAVRQEVVRHEKGAVTERHVAAAAAAGARLVLGRRAVLTPLARERARACGLAVERED
ncbi:hypothetical protein [Microbispora sp. KK1-11]|uniref:hypothetical protein n=1 Tax=Microbispora sp. KK1-11 TaxID=2053005 RepID=UPI001158EC60|nr:hypothetical protein [Microbispora sp. KK1-11]TQS24546.1 hypothetical protein FLW16_34730 [Microbispora sp. KK1-11]